MVVWILAPTWLVEQFRRLRTWFFLLGLHFYRLHVCLFSPPSSKCFSTSQAVYLLEVGLADISFLQGTS